MQRSSRSASRAVPGATAPAVSVLALAARSGTVDLSSLAPGTVALIVGLTLVFLAPIAVAALLIATDERTRSDWRTTDDRQPRTKEISEHGTADALVGDSARTEKAMRRTDRSTEGDGRRSRVRPDRSER